MSVAPADAPRVLVFVPQCPWPALSGTRQRHAALVESLLAEGAHVTVACNEPAPATAPVDVLSAPGGGGGAPRRSVVRSVRRRLIPVDEDLRSSFFASPGLRAWIAEVVAQHQPSHIVVGHSWWAGVLPPTLAPKLLDTTDIVTMNRRLWKQVEAELGAARPLDVRSVTDAAIDAAEAPGARARRHEFALYDDFDVTVAISEPDAATIRAHVRHTDVRVAPMTIAPVETLKREPRGAAVFVTGSNPYNVHGYAYLAHRVLPEVVAGAPDLHVSLVGSGAADVLPVPGVTVVGPIDDLAPVYAAARFAVSPVRVGTGAQIKIIEAMAHGVAPVVFAGAAARAGVVHEQTGLVATTADEFAAAMLRLWHDGAYAAELGGRAQEAARTLHDAAALRSIVSKFLQLQ